MKNDSLFIKDKDYHIKVMYDEIVWIESDGNRCHIHTSENKFLVNFSLKRLVEKFPSDQFVRIHQQYGINSHRITSVDLLNNKVLLERKELPLGRSYRKKLIKRLNRI